MDMCDCLLRECGVLIRIRGGGPIIGKVRFVPYLELNWTPGIVPGCFFHVRAERLNCRWSGRWNLSSPCVKIISLIKDEQ